MIKRNINNMTNLQTERENRYNKVLEYLIIILVFLTPLSRAGLNIFSFLILLVWISKAIFCPQTRKINIEYKKYFLYLALIISLSIINAVDIEEFIGTFFSVYFKYSILFLIVLEVIKKKSQVKKVLISFFTSSLFVYFFGFYQYFNGQRRIFSTLHNPNPFGSYLLIVLLLSFGILMFKNLKRYKILSMAYIILGLLLLLFSYSRGAWLGLISGILFFLGSVLVIGKYEFSTKKIIMSIITISLFLIIISSLYLPTERIMTRFESIFEISNNSNSYRLMQYRTSLSMIKDKPFLGFGIGQYPLAFENYKPNNINRIHLHVHNIFLHIAVETGLFGLIAFMYIFYKIFPFKKIMSINQIEWYHYSILAIMVSFLVHNLFDVTILYSTVGINLMILIPIWINLVNGNID